MKKLFAVALTFTLLFLLNRINSVGATEHYVSTSGSDSNSGSQSSPLRTISKCVSIVSAGDTCIVRGGTYREKVRMARGGTAGNVVTLKNYTGERPIIDGELSRETLVIEADYIVIDGIVSTKSKVYGMKSVGNNHITFKNCEVSWSEEGGLVSRDGSHTYVDNCEIHHSNQLHARGGSAGNEGLSVKDIDTFEIKNSIVRDCAEEGIDAKYNARNGKIHHNLAYRNNGPNLYIDAAHDIDVYNNYFYTTYNNKSNVSLAVESTWNPNEYDMYNVRLYNNIIRSTYGGITMWIESGAKSFADVYGIRIYNNLFYDHGDKGAVRLLTDTSIARDMEVKNNIFWKNGKNVTNPGNGVFSHNIFDSNPYGSNAITVNDIGFVDESNLDFHLNSDSPGVDAGTTVNLTFDYDETGRPQGSGYDIGPYEYGGGSPPPPPPPPDPDPTCPGDYDDDGQVSVSDFGVFASNYKQNNIDCSLDLDGDDCYLGISDFAIFGGGYKLTCDGGTVDCTDGDTGGCGTNSCQSTQTSTCVSGSWQCSDDASCNLPPVEGDQIYPTEDSYVNGDFPTSNYGSQDILKVDSEPINIAYLKFNLSPVSSVSSAKLYVRTTTSTTTVAQTLHAVTDTTWNQSTLNYNNMPSVGSQLGTVPALGAETWASIDVTNYVNQQKGNIITLALQMDDPDGVFYSSSDSEFAPYIEFSE